MSGGLPQRSYSRQSLLDDVNDWAEPQGFTLQVQRTSKKNGQTWIYLACDRRRKPHLCKTLAGCKYSVLAKESSGTFYLTHRRGSEYAHHDHELNVFSPATIWNEVKKEQRRGPRPTPLESSLVDSDTPNAADCYDRRLIEPPLPPATNLTSMAWDKPEPGMKPSEKLILKISAFLRQAGGVGDRAVAAFLAHEKVRILPNIKACC